jgi:glycosyltransferase involved in cell wall biosynthesis
MPRVSVIIPTYNRASVVSEAIQSVLEQTFTDYETIVVDDGSTDNTRELVRKLDNGSGNIRYIYQTNRGVSAARNHGISLAKGDYVAFLDSDDKWLPEKLHIQVQALDKNPEYGMAYSYFLRVSNSGDVIKESGKARTRLSGWIYPEILFIKGTAIQTSTVIVRTCVLREIGGFDEKMRICEDLDLWRRIAILCKVLQIERTLSIYTIRMNVPAPWLESVQARSFFYRKAIAEDPGLKNTIESKLFSEMYFNYGLGALYRRDTSLALRFFRRSAKANSLLFLRLKFTNTLPFFRSLVIILGYYLSWIILSMMLKLSTALHLEPVAGCRRLYIKVKGRLRI